MTKSFDLAKECGVRRKHDKPSISKEILNIFFKMNYQDITLIKYFIVHF